MKIKILKVFVPMVLIFSFIIGNLCTIQTTLIFRTDNIKNSIVENEIDINGFTELDFLETNGTKIVNQSGEEVILRGYNLGLWLSRSFWGLPISMEHNENDTERYSPVNSMQIDYELFNNPNLTDEQVEELNKTFYSNQITTTDLDLIAETGANLVRIPFEWTFFMRPVYDQSIDDGNKNDADYNNYGALNYIDTTCENASNEDKAFFNSRLQYLREIVDECKKRKIYVIFDLHVAPGGLNAGGVREAPYFFEKGEKGFERRCCAIRIWRKIAEAFKNNPSVAGYDILNEPAAFKKDSPTYTYVIDFYNEAYKTIREIEKNSDNKHIIIMEQKVLSYSNSNVDIEMDTNHGGMPHPDDYGWTNVIYSKHDYFFNFNNVGDDVHKNEEWQKDNPDMETMKARIKNSIEETKYTMAEYNIPVWIGEFSCHAYYNKKDKEGNIILDEQGNPVIVGTFQGYVLDEDGNIEKDEKGNNKIIRYPINEEKTKEIWDYQIQLYEDNNISYAAWTYKACWEKYFGLIYYGRKTNVNRINLKTATYEQINNVFSGNSSDIMNYNNTFHNIIKGKIEIFEGIDISVNRDESVIAKLSSDKTVLTITGKGEMITTWEISDLAPWHQYADKIETIQISEGVKNIGRLAFYECIQLKNIEIPNSITNIGHSAFYKCSNLENIYVYESNANYTSEKGVLYNKDKTKIIKYPEGKSDTEYIIPSSVISIEQLAFSKTKLTSIIIPKEVTEIGNNTFTESNELTIICKSGTEIENYAIKNRIPYLVDKNAPQITFSTNGTTQTVISTSTKITVDDLSTEIVTGIDYTNLKYYWGKRSEGVSESEIITKFLENQTIRTPKQQGTYYLWILARDQVGNETKQRSNAFYIDAIPPTVTVNSMKDGNVTITANEKLQEVVGWVLSKDKTVLTKKYTESKTETIIIKDLLGNETGVLIEAIVNNDMGFLSDKLIIDEENLVIKNIQPNTTVIDLKQNLQSEIEYDVINKKGEYIIETSLLSTGDKIKLKNNKIYTLLITGDSNGDGQANLKDMIVMNKYRLNKVTLTTEYLLASDINKDGEIDLKDMIKINKFRLRKIEEL